MGDEEEEQDDSISLVREVLEAAETVDVFKNVDAWRMVAMEMIKTDPRLFLRVFKKFNDQNKKNASGWSTKDFNVHPWTDADLREEMALGRKIQAIKRYRVLMGQGLSESKKAVDAMMELMPTPIGNAKFGQVQIKKDGFLQ